MPIDLEKFKSRVNAIQRERIAQHVGEIKEDNSNWYEREIVKPFITYTYTHDGPVQSALKIVGSFVPGVGEALDIAEGNPEWALIGAIPLLGDSAQAIRRTGKEIIKGVSKGYDNYKLLKRDFSLSPKLKITKNKYGQREIHIMNAKLKPDMAEVWFKPALDKGVGRTVERVGLPPLEIRLKDGVNLNDVLDKKQSVYFTVGKRSDGLPKDRVGYYDPNSKTGNIDIVDSSNAAATGIHEKEHHVQDMLTVSPYYNVEKSKQHFLSSEEVNKERLFNREVDFLKELQDTRAFKSTHSNDVAELNATAKQALYQMLTEDYPYRIPRVPEADLVKWYKEEIISMSDEKFLDRIANVNAYGQDYVNSIRQKEFDDPSFAHYLTNRLKEFVINQYFKSGGIIKNPYK